MNHVISLAFCTVLIPNVDKPSNDFDLDSYRWKNRLVLLFTEEVSNEMLNVLTLDLHKDKEGLLNQEIRVFKISKSQKINDLLSNETMWMDENLRKELYVPENGFYVMLMGKDGAVKFKDSNPIAREKLFAIIDAMPMRQAEMNRKNRER